MAFHRARTHAYLTQAGLSGTVRTVTDEAAIEGRHLAIAGLREAVAAIAPPDLVPATLRTSEALFWASALGDLTVPAERHHLYRALQIPRNAVAHGAAICVGVQNGLVWPVTSPMKWTDVVWAPLDPLLATLDRPPRASSAESYQRELAGRSVVPVLADVLAWYDKGS